jgi:hypothetical protein
MFIIFLLVIIGGFILFYSFLKREGYAVDIEHIDIDSIKPGIEHLPYIKRKYLMTPSELNFYRIIERINKDKYFIIPQVSLAKLVSVDEREIMKKTYHNKIDRKSVDFAVFNKDNFEPLYVIELDDRTHNKWDRYIRDKWVDEVMNKVGIKILHIQSSPTYTYDTSAITSLLNA